MLGERVQAAFVLEVRSVTSQVEAADPPTGLTEASYNDDARVVKGQKFGCLIPKGFQPLARGRSEA